MRTQPSDNPSQRPKATRGPRRRIGLGILAAVLVLGSLVSGHSAPTASAEEEGFKLVGALPSTQLTPLLVDPTSRRIFALENDHIDAYDGVTLQKVATTQLAPNRTFLGAQATYAWSPGQNELYLLVYGPLPGGMVDSNRTKPLLATLDPGTLQVKSVRPIGPSLFPPGTVPVGMSYYAPEHKLYVVGQSTTPFAGDYSVMLTEVDVASATAWTTPYSVGNRCAKLIATNRQAAVHRLDGTTRVYFGCGTGNFLATPQPGLPGIAAVDIADPLNPTTTRYGVAGTYGAGDSMYDPVAGRLILVSAGVAFPYQAAWVFDETHNVIVGIVNAGSRDIQSVGLDQSGGRIYVGIKTNEVLSASYLGRRVPQATSVMLPPTLVGGTITPIGFANRIIVPRQVVVPGKPPVTELSVYEHSYPDYVAPPTVDPDASTVDVPEAPDKTDVTYSGDGKAFGARIHQVAGINGILQNIVIGEYWTNTGAQLGLNDGDRDLYFARLSRMRLGQSEASASAATTEGDANTKADYIYLTKSSWPYKAATCADLGKTPNKGTADDASTSCDAAGALVEASALHEKNHSLPFPDQTTPMVSFGSSSSRSTLRRDAKLGTVVETTAESKDIVIGGVIRIGRITSTSTSAAKGRPGTSSATYERKFENVTTPARSCTNDCDPQTVVNDINEFAPQLNAELPGYELTQTPRGARGSALRDPWQHEQDLLVNNEADTALETPALRLSYVHDNSSRSRIIYEFAATMANSTYSIYKLSSFDFDDDDVSFEDFEPPLSELLAGSDAIYDEFTNESADDVPPSAAVARLASNDGKDGDGSFARRLGQGLRLLFTGRRALILNALLWSLLSIPVFLIGRRRHLLRLIGGSV